jgi:hypothetical protein
MSIEIIPTDKEERDSSRSSFFIFVLYTDVTQKVENEQKEMIF